MLKKEEFLCKQCGECCKFYTVKLTESDIKRIQALGYTDFSEPDSFEPEMGRYALRKNKDGCIFLEKKDSKYFCQIYENCPEICKKYPFFNEPVMSCKPGVGKWMT